MADHTTDTDTPVFESYNRSVSIMGLPKLLRAVASRIESEAEGLTRELLEQSAQRIEHLEAVATVATHVISLVPYKREGGQSRSKVPRDTLIRLCDALNQTQDFRVRRIR